MFFYLSSRVKPIEPIKFWSIGLTDYITFDVILNVLNHSQISFDVILNVLNHSQISFDVILNVLNHSQIELSLEEIHLKTKICRTNRH